MARPVKKRQFTFARKPGSICLMRDLIRFANFLKEDLNFELTVDGLDIQETSRGVHLKGGMGVDDTHPFKCGVYTSGPLFLTVLPGTINGRMAKLSGQPLDAATRPSLSITSSGSVKVWLKLSFNFDVSDGVIVNAELDEVNVEAGSTVPDDDPGGDFYLQIGTVNDGVPLPNAVRHSLWVQVCDNGSGEGEGVLRAGEAG